MKPMAGRRLGKSSVLDWAKDVTKATSDGLKCKKSLWNGLCPTRPWANEVAEKRKVAAGKSLEVLEGVELQSSK